MVRQYIQSEENYKGFRLQIVMTCLDDRRNNYHRSCHVFKGNERISIGKTKKEIKDLIDGGYIK